MDASPPPSLGPRPWREGLLDFIATRPHLHLFLDFDGTLTPIAVHPDDAHLSQEARDVLALVLARAATRVVLTSGRHLAGLVKKVDDPALDLIGNHGLEWRVDGLRGEDPAVARVAPAMTAIGTQLQPRVAATAGAVLEQKGGSLSLHLRGAEPSAAASLASLLDRLVLEHPEVITHPGRGLIEVRPRVGPNKGTAIERLLVAAHGTDWDRDCAAVFLGDDRTDEDGFAVLGERGAGVRVLGGEGPTLARYCAASVGDVLSLLAAIGGR